MDALAIMALRPSFQALNAVQLDDQTRRALYISGSLGHAFTALTDQAAVLNLCSTLARCRRDAARDAGTRTAGPTGFDETGRLMGWPSGTVSDVPRECR
jgi:dTDP-4-dehydrorhamnose 3,5-epimerase